MYVFGIVLPWALCSTPLAAAEPSRSDVITASLEQIRVTNQARADLAREEGAWTNEHQRLKAVLAATQAENGRLEREAVATEARRDMARSQLAALGNVSDLDALRTRLAEAGMQLGESLTRIAATLPPGVIPAISATADERGYESVVRALESAERAACTVTVDVVTGERDGKPEAVKALRVAGAIAWWVALDGSAAGTLHCQDGRVKLSTVSDVLARNTIITALAQIDGHGQPGVLLLPVEQP